MDIARLLLNNDRIGYMANWACLQKPQPTEGTSVKVAIDAPEQLSL